jgi:hypothetical protein
MNLLAIMSVIVTAAISGPGVSKNQLALARAATGHATQVECNREETYLRVGEIPMKVGHCENVRVGTAFQDLKARQNGQRRILVLGRFVIHDRFGPTDGQKVEHRKLFRWWVPAPQFGWLFAHEAPVTPWVSQVVTARHQINRYSGR